MTLGAQAILAEAQRHGWHAQVLTDRCRLPELVPGDVLLVNSASIAAPARDGILAQLGAGWLARVVWFVHEDVPERYFGPSGVSRP